jgi:hypothetical protein
VTLGEMVVMPNHVHGVVFIHPPGGNATAPFDAGPPSRDRAPRWDCHGGVVPVGATHASPLRCDVPTPASRTSGTRCGVPAETGRGTPTGPGRGTPSGTSCGTPTGPRPGAPPNVPAIARPAARRPAGGAPRLGAPAPPVDAPSPTGWAESRLVHRGGRGPAAASLGAIVGAFKAAAARRVNLARGTPGAALWQRSYHDRIIPDRHAL